jgi:hypothetical protein
VNELTVAGNRGAGLTAASRLHRRLIRLGIANEIRCNYLSSVQVSVVEVQFLTPLSEAQQRAVHQVLAPLLQTRQISAPAPVLAAQPK